MRSVKVLIFIVAVIASSCSTMGGSNTDSGKAVEKYRLIYEIDGTSWGAPIDKKEYTPGEEVQLAGAGTVAKKEGFSFAGWNTQADGRGTLYRPGGVMTMGSKNVVLYASWIRDEAKYNVTYYANAPGRVTGTVPVDTRPYSSDDSVTVMGNTGKMDVEGFRFNGWVLASDAKGRILAPGEQLLMPEGGMHLYANWEIKRLDNFTVTYDLNGVNGVLPVDPKSYAVGSEVRLADGGVVPTRAGFTFAGWNTQADGRGTLYRPGGVMTMGAKNVVLYATWIKNEAKYNVTYYANAPGKVTGKIPVDSRQYISEESVIVFGNTGNMQVEGYRFDGWSSTVNGKEHIAPGSQKKMGVGGMRFYAKWKPILISKNDISQLRSLPYLSTWKEDTSNNTSIELINHKSKYEYIKGDYRDPISDQSIIKFTMQLVLKSAANKTTILEDKRFSEIVKKLFDGYLTDIDQKIEKVLDLKKLDFGAYLVTIVTNGNQFIAKIDLVS